MVRLIGSDIIRGYIDVMILHLLLEGDSYGYELSRQIESRSDGAYQIKETTLYSAVARLEKKGCIDSYFGEESFGRRRTYYRITGEGQRLYREKCEEWTLTKRVIDRFTRTFGKDEHHG